MTKQQAIKFIKGLEAGLIPEDAISLVLPGTVGPEALRKLQAAIPAEEFDCVMKELVYPNRAAADLRKYSPTIETDADWIHFQRRIHAELRELRP